MRGEGWQVDYTLVSDTQVASYLATPSVDLHRNMTAIFYQSISLREWRYTKNGRNSSFYEYHIPHRCTLAILNNTYTETRSSHFRDGISSKTVLPGCSLMHGRATDISGSLGKSLGFNAFHTIAIN